MYQVNLTDRDGVIMALHALSLSQLWARMADPTQPEPLAATVKLSTRPGPGEISGPGETHFLIDYSFFETHFLIDYSLS